MSTSADRPPPLEEAKALSPVIDAGQFETDLVFHSIGVSFTLTEPVNWKFLKGVFGEFIGTMLLLFITITTVCYTAFEAPDASLLSTSVPASRFSIAMCFGFSIFVLIYMFESVSETFSCSHLRL